jgi:hypothetical protein
VVDTEVVAAERAAAAKWVAERAERAGKVVETVAAVMEEARAAVRVAAERAEPPVALVAAR